MPGSDVGLAPCRRRQWLGALTSDGRLAPQRRMSSADAGDPTGPLLLIVIPGRSDREPVLRRLVAEVGPVAVLVPARFASYCAWAHSLAAAWIEFGSPGGAPTAPICANEAWEAVSKWMAAGGPTPLGCTTWDEWGIEICAHLCAKERLNLPYTPLETVRQVRNKARFRETCVKGGVPAPRFANIHSKAQLEAALAEAAWTFPVILKPAKGAGSFHCLKSESEEHLLEAFPRLNESLLGEQKTPKEDAAAGWVLEEFFSGAEVDVDGWAQDGKVAWMLVGDNKPARGKGCCEAGGMYPSQLPADVVRLLEGLTEKVISIFPGIHSAFSFEALVDPVTKAVMPVELNLRIGGAECPCCVEAVSGVFLPLAAADLALGRPMRPPAAAKVAAAASTNEYAPHAGTVRACQGSKELHADPDFLGGAFFATEGSAYLPDRGSMSCLCWLAAGGSSADEAERNLQRCISLCDLQVVPPES